MYEFTVLQFWASVMAIDRAEDTMCSANYFKNNHLNTHGLTIVSSEIETPQPPDLTYMNIYIHMNIYIYIYKYKYINIYEYIYIYIQK